MNEQVAIEVASLHVRYGGLEVLNDINFSVPRGEFVAVIGPSGCGKSTLLNVLGGFVRPSSGKALIDGRSPQAKDLRRGMVFQEYALFPWRSARRNVEFALEAQGMPKDARRDKAREFLELVKLSDFADSYPHELSGGMKQRVAIARSLASEPTVLLMDEPLGALDALTRENVMQLVADVWSQTQQTVLYVTHNVSEAVYLADRVIVFTPGPPGVIKKDVAIELDRPRDLLSDGVVSYQRLLTELVSEHGDSGGNGTR